jgi:endoglucanase
MRPRRRRLVVLTAAITAVALLVLVAGVTFGVFRGMRAKPGNPLSMTNGFYVDPDSQPENWVLENRGDSRRSTIESGIADRPLARWYNGGSSDASDARSYVSAAAAKGRLPVLVAYNIPLRDCGSYSSGGADSAAAYRSWARDLAAAIGGRPAVVILEPDALPGMDCMSGARQRERLALLAYAVDQFAAAARNTWVYLDAGHADWTPAGEMASRLESAHVNRARGFALNVSNYQSTARNVSYAKAVNRALGMNKRFVVDTSRNGRPSDGSDWCNPSGQRVGASPGEGGAPGLDLQLWVKIPGESDGDCGIGEGTDAGEFVPDIAVQLLGGS